MPTSRTAVVRALIGAAAMLATDAALAQQQTPSGDNQSDAVQEVIVTAQRRAERLQDVPISIAALSSADLSRSGIGNTSELQNVVPGVQMTYNGGYLQPAIRGVSSAGSDAGDSSNVALYIDGVYQPSQPGQLVDLPDVQQVEVLKGPQGTLYGQNAEGGAIIITTLAPSLTPTGAITVGYGNYNDALVRGYMSGPINDKLAVSLSGSHEKHQGYTDDLVYGGHDDGLRSDMVRGKVLFRPTDALSITATGYWTHRFDSSLFSGQPYNGNSLGYLLFPNAPRATSWHQSVDGFRSSSDITAYGGSVHAELGLEAGKLLSTTAYVHTKVFGPADVDYSPANIADVTVHQEQHDWTEEIDFISNKLGSFSITTGAFFLDGSDAFNPNVFVFHAPVTLAPAPAGPAALALTEYLQLEKKVAAAYAELTYNVTDRLILTAGGRYSYEQQRAFGNETAPDVFLTTPADFEAPFSPANFKKFTPRVTARFALTPDSNIYASYGKGFKSGLLSVSNFFAAPVRPETLTAYEVGYKGKLLRDVALDIAAYDYEYQDLQVARYVAPDYIYQNAAQARIRGLDVNLKWTVLPQLVLAASASLLDGKYTKFPLAGIFVQNPLGGNLNENIDASGQRMIRSPTVTANFTADYHLDTQLGRFGLYAGAYHNGGYKLEISGRIQQPAYTTLDAEASFSPAAATRLRFVLWGKNLTDAARLQSILQTSLGDGVSYQPPRTFGVRAEFQF